MAVKNVYIGIKEEDLLQIDKRAKELGRSRSSFIRFTLTEYIKYEREKENTETELRNEIAELKKQLLSIIPVKVETKSNDDDLLEPMNFNFPRGL